MPLSHRNRATARGRGTGSTTHLGSIHSKSWRAASAPMA
jgi:hypothetical protein